MDPFVSANVVYFNSHGFPRAAIITATRDSLAGEQHVSLLEHDRDVHLVVFSPLPRTYPELHVPYGGTAHLPIGTPGTWCWPNEAPPARGAELPAVVHAVIRSMQVDDTLCVHNAPGDRAPWGDVDAVTCPACLQSLRERRERRPYGSINSRDHRPATNPRIR